MKKIFLSTILLMFVVTACEKPGCTDPNAHNYNAKANQEDGSCLYGGCTDPVAINYDWNADLDDGSCYY